MNVLVTLSCVTLLNNCVLLVTDTVPKQGGTFKKKKKIVGILDSLVN